MTIWVGDEGLRLEERETEKKTNSDQRPGGALQ
jgi:hypothetical protein